MKTLKYATPEECQAAIEQFNTLLGFPDEKSDTLTYAGVPAITEVEDEDGNVTESYYELVITSELEAILWPEEKEEITENVN